MSSVLIDLYDVIKSRKEVPVPNSYTNYLFDQGLDKVLKKCGEELTEVIIAAKNGNNDYTVNEICDLLYHLTVLMAMQDIEYDDIFRQLAQRGSKIGNLKERHSVDKNS